MSRMAKYVERSSCSIYIMAINGSCQNGPGTHLIGIIGRKDVCYYKPSLLQMTDGARDLRIDSTTDPSLIQYNF